LMMNDLYQDWVIRWFAVTGNLIAASSAFFTALKWRNVVKKWKMSWKKMLT